MPARPRNTSAPSLKLPRYIQPGAVICRSGWRIRSSRDFATPTEDRILAPSSISKLEHDPTPTPLYTLSLKLPLYHDSAAQSVSKVRRKPRQALRQPQDALPSSAAYANRERTSPPTAAIILDFREWVLCSIQPGTVIWGLGVADSPTVANSSAGIKARRSNRCIRTVRRLFQGF
jgi:hypothetical protein